MRLLSAWPLGGWIRPSCLLPSRRGTITIPGNLEELPITNLPDRVNPVAATLLALPGWRELAFFEVPSIHSAMMKRSRSNSGPNAISKDCRVLAVTQLKNLPSRLGRIDPQIWIALLGIIGTFIASPLAVQIYNQFQLPAISDKRRQTLEGRWEGTGTQELSEIDKTKVGTKQNVKKFPAHLNLSVKGRTINGTLDIIGLKYDDNPNRQSVNTKQPPDHTLIEHKEISYNLTGNMVASNYLRLDYVSNDPAVIEFGTLLLRLPSTGGKLEGKYVSFGPITERLVNGEYTFSQSR